MPCRFLGGIVPGNSPNLRHLHDKPQQFWIAAEKMMLEDLRVTATVVQRTRDLMLPDEASSRDTRKKIDNI